MYNKYFGFKCKPFHITPDQEFLYMTPAHKEALACMEFGLLTDTGIILITGEIGTGKTTLIRRFLIELPDDAGAACILNTNITAEQLLAMLLQEFGIGNDYRSKAQAVKDIQTGLQAMWVKKERPVLIIDDAHNLSPKALEEVRWLSNLQDDRRMLVQVILVGQPELKTKLAQPAMASLVQRISVNFHLGAFSREEVGAYIAHRLSLVGGSGKLFTEAAVDLIHEKSRGIPRIINLLCDHSLMYAFADDAWIVELPSVEQAVAASIQSSLAASSTPDGTGGTSLSVAATPGAPGDEEQSAVGKRLLQLETRLAALEQLVSRTGQEISDMFKTLMTAERDRSDNLRAENILLKLRQNEMKNRLQSLQNERKNSEKPAVLVPAKRRGPQNAGASVRKSEVLALRKKKGQE